MAGGRHAWPRVRVWCARAEFRVVVQRSLQDKSAIHEDRIVLQQAQPDMVKTIAYLLAQTVALHFYEMCARAPWPPPTCRLPGDHDGASLPAVDASGDAGLVSSGTSVRCIEGCVRTQEAMSCLRPS